MAKNQLTVPAFILGGVVGIIWMVMFSYGC